MPKKRTSKDDILLDVERGSARKENQFKPGLMPTTAPQWHSLAKDLLRWSELPSAQDIRDFGWSRKYSFRQLKNWAEAKHNDYYSEVWIQVKERVGLNRERQFFDHYDYVKSTMPIYNEEYREFLLEKKNKEQQEKQAIILEVEVPK